jgi:outer membrane protein TolC
VEALKNGSVVFVLTLFPALAGCTTTVQSTGSDRAIAIYRESLGPRGALSFRHERAGRREREDAANDVDTSPRTLTVDAAIAMAKKNSMRLLALEASAAAAEASVLAANQIQNPELNVTQLRLDQLAKGGPQLRTSLRFFPDRPGAIAANVAEARAKHAQALANLHTEELAIEADVRWSFDDVVLLDAEISAARAVAQTRQSLATQMHARMDASEATSTDETLAELSALEAAADLALQEARRKEALGTLYDRIGLSPDASTEIIGDPPLAWPPAELVPEQTLIEQALRRSPGVAVAAVRIDAADARLFAERAKRFPWFTFLEAGYQFSPNTTPGLGWIIQGGVDLPIFNTNSNGIAASDAAKTAAERGIEAEVERVARDVRARLREVRVAEDLVSNYRRQALPVADKAGKEAQRALEGRSIDTIRALSVDERRAAIQLHLLRLIRRYRTAISELRRISGKVNSEVTP